MIFPPQTANATGWAVSIMRHVPMAQWPDFLPRVPEVLRQDVERQLRAECDRIRAYRDRMRSSAAA